MKIEVLGSCCGNCQKTMELIDEVAREKGADIELVKIDDLKQIMGYGVMSTPGVVIDGTVVHAGGMPSRARVEQWLAGAETVAERAARCCG
jgi:small redox-active disulfide protein 2